TRKLSLTEAGETYYEQTREIVQAVEEADLAVTERRADPSGTLRLTAPTSMARLHVAPAIAAFHMQYPNVRVVIKVTDRPVDIVGEGLDVAIRIGRLEDSSLMARKIGEARRLICASPAYLKRAGTPQHPGDLADHSCVIYRTSPGKNLWEFCAGKKPVQVQVSGPLFCDDGETLVSAACAGLGLILVPEWLAGPEVSAGRLVEALPGFQVDPDASPLYAVYAPGAYTPPKIRAFVDFLSGRFSRNYTWAQQH
ncbi:MAG: LysR substrate-binding domain-containing protein, partial [Aestuariivirgaceae bacterium]